MAANYRFALLAVVTAMTSSLLITEVSAEMKFASDEVAKAAKAPATAEALAARKALDAAFFAQNVDAVAALFAEDLVVNSPANGVSRKSAIIERFKAGRMNYEEAEETIEALDLRDDQLVIMGGEIIKPQGAAANAGKTVKRRFTDVWRKESDGKWRLTIRQATITSVE